MHGNLFLYGSEQGLYRTCAGVSQRRYFMETQKQKKAYNIAEPFFSISALFAERLRVLECRTMQFQTCRFGVRSMGNGESWYETLKS